MAFFDKISDMAKNIGDKTGDAIETSKLNSEVTSKKREVAQLKQKIGVFYYDKYKKGDAIDVEALELFTDIDGLNLQINDLEAKIKKIKKGDEVKTETKEEEKSEEKIKATMQATSLEPSIKCLNCGAENDLGKKFCSQCGARIEDL